MNTMRRFTYRWQALKSHILYGVGILCLLSNGLVAQNKVSDLVQSVSERLSEPIEDSLQLYTDAHRARQLSEETNNLQLLATSFTNLARWHEGTAEIDSTMYYLNKANTLFEEADSKNHQVVYQAIICR